MAILCCNPQSIVSTFQELTTDIPNITNFLAIEINVFKRNSLQFSGLESWLSQGLTITCNSSSRTYRIF